MDIPPDLCGVEQMAEFYCRLFSDSGGTPVFRLDGSHYFNEILQTCISSACRFIAINQAIGAVDITKRLFPRSLRCTVHPKPGQIGLHTINKSTSIFAHCGQGIVPGLADGRIELRDIRVDFRANILRDSTRSYGITLDPGEYPFATASHPFVVVQGALS
jgi:hypothetical protein